jgi:catalase
MDEFLARHPETKEAMDFIEHQRATSGFGDCTFHGLNAFRFTNAAGESTPVRWIVKPTEPWTTAPSDDKDFMFDELIKQFHVQKKLQWDFIVIVGKPGDPTNDATKPWGPDREQVNVGTLTPERIESDDTSAARDINFDPLVLPDGIAPSDDPLLSARSAVYSKSFTRREGETKPSSPITPAQVEKGE